jgi:hypothetical protein
MSIYKLACDITSVSIMDFDLVTIINLALCLLVFFAGYLSFRKEKNSAWLYISLAFVLFALSHLVALAGASAALYDPMVAIRALGYLLVIFGISKGAPKAAAQEPAAAPKARRKK